jgi:hypothetical protein
MQAPEEKQAILVNNPTVWLGISHNAGVPAKGIV